MAPVLVLLWLLFFANPAQLGCPDQFQDIFGACILFSETQMNFFKAWESCRKLNSTLVSLDNSAKMISIIKHMRTTSYWYHNWWLGGTDLGEKDRWVWIGNGQQFNFSRWCSGQPNNYELSNERCVFMTNDGSNLCWDDYLCHRSFRDGWGPIYYICEMEKT